VAKLYLRW